MGVNLPKDILKKEAFKTLPAKEKEEYLSNLLKKILELNPEGVTISQLREATGLTYSTIWHHLEVLSCTAQCHKISRGNTDIFYHHGNSNHLNEFKKDKVHYTISTVENDKGKFVCIQETRENRLGNHTVQRGIDIPFDLMSSFISEFEKIKKANLGIKGKSI